ncbi:hypothetical protein [Dictyobacter aurantiacus]|uniref:hypothetical protein n=1 Tax=Dictyobacter aurantiacus TaxID=1936993 RepID=UPI000F824852|nr:hypothetical protein [Dictyobacter aurantiacus]
MRCSHCGMPLSPSRTSCPRCGATVGNGGIRTSGKVRLTHDPAPSPSNSFTPDSANANQDAPAGWGVVAPVTFPQKPPVDVPHAPGQAGQFSPTSQPYPSPQMNGPLPVNTGARQNMYVPSTPTPARQTTPQAPRMPMPAPPPIQRQSTPPRQPRIKLGFTVAGMCLMAGFLIMVFVFIMAQSLPLPQNAASSNAAPQQSMNQPVATQPATTPAVSTPQTSATQPAATQPAATQPQATPTASSTTPTMPVSSNLYVDNASLTNGVNTQNGQPLQPTQTFRLGQLVYVTMVVHQPAYNGAICLSWSVNNQAYPYASPANPGGATYLAQTSAYFYYKPGTTGPGFVDIYWASSTACTDKVLVQHLPFTITA